MAQEPEWMHFVSAPLALLFVAGLIVLMGAWLKKIGLDKRLSGHKGPARLQLVETLYLDPKRRLVIVRQDGNEHTLLLGATGDILVATNTKGALDAS